ncbi:MAG: ATP-dependent Clp protease ATP-binding subunit, partial [Acutalibacteraceae bacterium]|nr:ATP-dependent Clp protease ATP-binding subunit [Acutalibacteraceae bacterium]
MLCCKCNKRPAVVFVSDTTNNKPTQGYCLSCANELGIKPVKDLMKNMGITDEQLESMQESMDSLMDMSENGEMPDLQELLGNADMSALMGMDSDLMEDGEDNPDKFTQGGAPTFPFNIFGGASQNKKGDNSKQKGKKKKESSHKHIDAYCTNLTERARNGKLDRVIGRDKEIARVIQILSRRSKNNPCLIGEPGVGKTAIAEGLALRITKGDVPQRLKDKEIQLLDLTALIAGTQFRGQFESRIKGLTAEVKAAGNIILFIDEVHNLVGTGDSEGTMNAANILKPALSRGEIQVIGATTFNEYRKYIEKDAALERRFQPVTVNEPSIKDTIEVLSGVKDYYEKHHRVAVPEQTIRRAVVLSERYITDRFLPDKAIDLLDEACACAALGCKAMEEYDKLNDNLRYLKVREEELAENQEAIDYEAVAKVRSEMAQTKEKLQVLEPEALGVVVEDKHLAKVIELWTGIPAQRVEENELNKLSDLEESMKKHIIGQDEAVNAIAKAVRRSRVQISPRRRPASFIFVGPTGVGKTELVKVLAEELFDTPETLIRLDMSEYMEKHAVSKIIGSPPGYVGYDEAGQVTEKVRRKPYSVLLFDEIEKAHPDVLNILLQILDEGKVTDAHGRVVNFENTVIVMTSNAGSAKTEHALGFGKTEENANREKVLKALREFLRPEFIARVDDIVVFRSLDENDFKGIAKLVLDEYVESLSEKGIAFAYDEKSAEFIANKSAGGKSGARDIRNFIRHNVEDKIATEIIRNGEGVLSMIGMTANDTELVLDV